MKLVSYSVLIKLFTYGLKMPNDSDVPIPTKSNTTSLAGFLQDINTFIVAGYRKMKILKKLLVLKFLTQEEHKIQKQLLRKLFQKCGKNP